MSGPGLKPGTRIDTPIYLQDVMPTTLELAEGRWLPDVVVRMGIRRLLRQRLREEAKRYAENGTHPAPLVFILRYYYPQLLLFMDKFN